MHQHQYHRHHRHHPSITLLFRNKKKSTNVFCRKMSQKKWCNLGLGRVRCLPGVTHREVSGVFLDHRLQRIHGIIGGGNPYGVGRHDRGHRGPVRVQGLTDDFPARMHGRGGRGEGGALEAVVIGHVPLDRIGHVQTCAGFTHHRGNGHAWTLSPRRWRQERRAKKPMIDQSIGGWINRARNDKKMSRTKILVVSNIFTTR